MMNTFFVDDNFFNIKKYGIKEGGISRNNAWRNWLAKKDYVKVKKLDSCRLLNYIKVCIFFMTVRKSKVFLLYPKVGLPVLGNGFIGNFLRKVFMIMARIMIKNRNTIILDVSDLKYEQAIDLKLNNLDMDVIEKFENQLFHLDMKFIFASYEMRKYAEKKYGISSDNSEVCINGGVKYQGTEKALPGTIDKKKANFVYAGTLNKGRMIEVMIEHFPKNEDKVLFLLGGNGEWLEEYLKENNRTNVIYMGAFEESVAQDFVANCDVGMIPYDADKMYYNIAYPTKLSFYLTSGIPFLSTPVNEAVRVQNENEVGYVEDIESWDAFIGALEKEAIIQKKAMVKERQQYFYWETIFEKSQFLKDVGE